MNTSNAPVQKEIVERRASYASEDKYEERSSLNDLRSIRNLILKFKKTFPELNSGLDNWLQNFGNSETDFVKGSQMPSLSCLSFAVLMDYEILGQFFGLLMKAGHLSDASRLCQITLRGYNGYFGFDYHKAFLAKLGISPSVLSINDYKEAVKASESFEATLQSCYKGSDHKFTLTVQHKIASIFVTQEKYSEALIILQDVYRKRNSAIALCHLETINVAYEISACLGRLDRHNESIELFQKLYERLRNLLGPGNDATLDVQLFLASMLCGRGQAQKSLELAEEVSERRQSKVGLDHPRNIEADALLARCHSLLGDHKKALELLRRVHKQGLKSLGQSHEITLDAQYGIGEALEALGKFTEALRAYKQVHSLQELYFGADHEYTVKALLGTAHCLESLQRNDEALEVLKQVLEKEMRSYGPSHLQTLNTERWIALVMAKQGKGLEAFNALDQVLEKLTNLLGSNYKDTLSLKRVIEVGKKQWAAKETGEKLICSICLEHIGFLEGHACFPYDCTHGFHDNCILPWLRDRTSCPECRCQLHPKTIAMIEECITTSRRANTEVRA